MSACIVIRSNDSHLADYLLKKYSTNSKAYEWLHIHIKDSKGNKNLASLFQYDYIYYMKVLTPKGKYSNNVTGFILEGVT